MAKYVVTMQVEYVVEADCEDCACERVAEGAEYPLVPHVEGDYCLRDIVQEVRRYKEMK